MEAALPAALDLATLEQQRLEAVQALHQLRLNANPDALLLGWKREEATQWGLFTNAQFATGANDPWEDDKVYGQGGRVLVPALALTADADTNIPANAVQKDRRRLLILFAFCAARGRDCLGRDAPKQ